MFKRLAQRILPQKTLYAIKQRYYAYILKHFPKDSWPAIFILEEIIPHNCIIIDAGANIGYVSKLLAGLAGPAGRVYSFEPIPETYAYLDYNIRTLKIDNVITYNLGLSNQTTELSMIIPKHENGLPNFYEAHISDQNNHEQALGVKVTSLDIIPEFAELPIAFMKIDVEGHEWPLIQGAKRIIESQHPVLFIEIDGNLDDPTGEDGILQAYLYAQGYEAYIQSDNKLAKRQLGQFAVDYFFIHKSTSIPNSIISQQAEA